MKLLIAILPTLLLTIYGQLIIKWRVGALFSEQEATLGFKARIVLYLSDPLILSAFISAFLAALAWFSVAEKYPVSIAFPVYTGILFALVALGGAVLLKETITLQHLLGMLIILLGVVVISRALT